MITIISIIVFISTIYGSPINEHSFDLNSLFDGGLQNLENLQAFLESSNEEEQWIFPGTKWCGQGNKSTGYDDLGEFVETDKCCREHDHCPDFILPGESNHDLTNESPYSTRLTCKCDEALKKCLHEANDEASRPVGHIYFDLYFTQKCFKKEYPIVKCTKKDGGLLKDKCLEYKFDKKQAKKYQWFDVPPF